MKFVPTSNKVVRNAKEISFIFLAMIAIYLVIALFTFHPADSGWSQAASTDVVHNSGGIVGAWISDLLLYLFGFFGYLIPLICVFDGIRLYQSRQNQAPINYYRISSRISGFMMFYIGGCGLLKIHFSAGNNLPTAIPGAGGVFGDGVSSIFLTTFGSVGSTLVLLSFFFIGLTLYSGLSWLWIIDNTGHWVLRISERLMNYQHDLREKIEGKKLKKVRETVIKEEIEKVDKR
ncbi:MAG: DNA translocase FtsK 4TM domain-containing protein, partial [Gammaproteobacteria bacterium]